MVDTCSGGGRRRKSKKAKRGGDAPQSESECSGAGGRWDAQTNTCLPMPAPLGGRRRRRTAKKTMRGGMGYGFGGALDGGTSGPAWNASWGGEITKSGEPIYDTADRPPVTGGRRRRSKKAKKGSKRRTMRGGATWQSIAPAGGGFTGQGARGLADWTGYASKVPPAGGPSQNPDGAYSP